MHYKTAIYYLLLCTRQQADSIMPATVVSLLGSDGQQLRKGERFFRSGAADHVYEMVDARRVNHPKIRYMKNAPYVRFFRWNQLVMPLGP